MSKKETRRRVGILGVPVTQRMFFSARDNDWSSDSDDSDYEPEKDMSDLNESGACAYVPRQNRKRKKSPVKREVRKRRCLNGASATCSSSSASFTPHIPPDDDSPIGYLPDELLLQVLQYCAQSEGSVPLYKRISTVCQRWYRLSSDLQLWRKVDLSYGWVQKTPAVWRRLCENRFSKLSHLTVNGWTDLDLKVLLTCSPDLEKLDLSRSWLSGESYDYLGQFKHLKELEIADMISRAGREDRHFTSGVQKVLASIGDKLEVFNICGNTVLCPSFKKIVEKIVTHCRNLLELDLRPVERSAITVSTFEVVKFPVRELQEHCPNMRVLRLPGCFALIPKPPVDEPTPGFPHLREFTAGNVGCEGVDLCGPDDALLHSLLHKSDDLRILSINNCAKSGLSGTFPWSLTFNNLESLHISKTILPLRSDLFPVFLSTHQSLRVLDLSRCMGSYNPVVQVLTAPGTDSRLQQLDLSFTTVTTTNIKDILEHCRMLTVFNLSSCRQLKRGMKRLYQNKAEIDQLREELGLTT